MLKKYPISEILNKGRQSAIPKSQLMAYFKISERDLFAQIERERLNGSPILAKKNDGGGYYLPACEAEIDDYLKLIEGEIESRKNVYLAIKNKKKAL